MGDEIDDSGQEATETQQDPLKLFLTRHKDLVDASLREPTKEELDIQRVKDIEKRLVELVSDEELKRFLESYQKKTGKPAIVGLVNIPEGTANPEILAISLTEGLIKYYRGKVYGSESEKVYELLQEDPEAAVEDPNGRSFKSEKGTVKNIRKAERISSYLGSKVFYARGTQSDEFLASRLAGLEPHSEPYVEINRDSATGWDTPTKDSINKTLLSNLESMAQEMQSPVTQPPTSFPPPPPAANRSPGTPPPGTS